MNLEAVSLIHIVNACVDIVAHWALHVILDMEPDMGIGSHGDLDLPLFSVHASF